MSTCSLRKAGERSWERKRETLVTVGTSLGTSIDFTIDSCLYWEFSTVSIESRQAKIIKLRIRTEEHFLFYLLVLTHFSSAGKKVTSSGRG